MREFLLSILSGDDDKSVQGNLCALSSSVTLCETVTLIHLYRPNVQSYVPVTTYSRTALALTYIKNNRN